MYMHRKFVDYQIEIKSLCVNGLVIQPDLMLYIASLHNRD